MAVENHKGLEGVAFLFVTNWQLCGSAWSQTWSKKKTKVCSLTGLGTANVSVKMNEF